MQEYDVKSADVYDNYSRRFIFWSIILVCIFRDRLSYKEAYNEFQQFYLFCGQQSLQRKINKLKFIGLMK